MKLILTCALVLVAVPAVAGPKRITVTIHATPEGAAVYANDAPTYMGQTPLELVYAMDGSSACQVRQGLEVRWVSGATAALSTLQLCPSTGKHQQYTFARPTDVPGADVDVSFDLQRQQLKILAYMANSQAVVNAFAAARLAMPAPLPYRPISCLTYPVGRFRQVWCQ